MGRRAQAQEETRQRIVEATMALHEEVGLRATSICAIAERAGVQRLTVYRHFPDDAAVFSACTGEWSRRNPAPGPELWQGIDDPAKRVSAALAAYYRYYAGTHRMWSVAHREGHEVAVVRQVLVEYDQSLAALARSLAPGRRGSKAYKRSVATIHHALSFPAWELMQRQGLDDGEKVALVAGWLVGATG
ncbi:hypothetical protein N788_00680 [Arenimonas donghaensis DSM 18148 = HO3-R19]|uniref:HTH tetR-type domain-containing protein n=2 Tax=Arenimonas TaxID=490567 RepID=A0A087MLG4_9GAMM|nr:hypothetical protein N788_00680 [Arenimonas donghaensis DSM 18148 = HO3-R19]